MAWGQGADRRLSPATALSHETVSTVNPPAEASAQTDTHGFPGLEIAVVIPCLDEELTVGQVVSDFKAALPGARIYVYDNGSADGTMEEARRAGAVVRQEPERGKGNVVRRMFADIDADIYVLVDGDATYPADQAPIMIRTLLSDHLDMVNGARVHEDKAAYRPGHQIGNRFITSLVGLMFGRRFGDILSGYRVLSRRFVKSFPALSKGFEIETEMTVHALEMRLPAAEVDAPYHPRPEGSSSKLRTVRHGIGIVRTIFFLIKEERPLEFFSSMFLVLELASIILAWPLMIEYLATGLVPRFPTAILSTGLALLGFLSLACGLILDTVTHSRQEIKRLHYLALPALSGTPPRRPAPEGSQADATGR